MTDIEIIDLTPENIADYGVCGGYQGMLEYIPCKYAHRPEVISHHPISNTRFENIMAKRQMGP